MRAIYIQSNLPYRLSISNESYNRVPISDEQALEIFEQLREMPFSHRGEKHLPLCEARAHRTAQILQEDFGASDVEKIWVYARSESDEKAYIRSPEHHYSDFDRRTNDEPTEYNFHVAPLVHTDSGRALVFDTKYYDAPPELSQWLADFPASEDTAIQHHIITDTQPYRFDRDVQKGGQDAWPAPVQSIIDNLSVSFDLWASPYQKQISPSHAEWVQTTTLTEDQADQDYESSDDYDSVTLS